jgi:uncharacterized membrane protein YozB (DUF420 family)
MAAAIGSMNATRLPEERRYFLWLTVATGIAVFVGFSRSFFLHPMFPDRHVPPEPFFMIHGTVFASWFVLLILQATLVTNGNVRLHRQLGVLGACLAAAMIALGVRGGLIAAHRAGGYIDVPIPPLVFLVVPLMEMVVFGVLVAFAIVKRGDPASHKRLMILASASTLSAAFARWPIVSMGGPVAFFSMADLFVIALLVWDKKSLGHLHPVTKWAGSFVVLSQPLRLLLASTPLWMAFATWAVGSLD